MTRWSGETGVLLQQHHILFKLNFCPLCDLVSLIALLSLIFSLVIGLFLYHTSAQQKRTAQEKNTACIGQFFVC